MSSSDYMTIRERDLKFKIRKEPTVRSQGDGVCPTDQWAVHEVFSRQVYSPSGFEIGPDDVVVDIGAHIGAFTMYAANQAENGRVFAIEPFPESYELLRESVKKNDFTDRVVAIDSAVTHQPRDDYRLYIDEENTCRHGLASRDQSSDHVEVEAVRLRDIFEEHDINQCDYLKMNCEGEECQILLNTPDDLLRSISKIAFEYHIFEDESDKNGDDIDIKEISNHLKDLGFEVFEDRGLIGSPHPMIFGKRDEN